MEQLGAPRIPLTGADLARWSHEIVTPSGSRGSSMLFCQPCPRMGLAGARFAGRWLADDVAGACGPWGGCGLRQPWGGGAAAAASRVRRQANGRGLQGRDEVAGGEPRGALCGGRGGCGRRGPRGGGGRRRPRGGGCAGRRCYGWRRRRGSPRLEEETWAAALGAGGSAGHRQRVEVARAAAA